MIHVHIHIHTLNQIKQQMIWRQGKNSSAGQTAKKHSIQELTALLQPPRASPPAGFYVLNQSIRVVASCNTSKAYTVSVTVISNLSVCSTSPSRGRGCNACPWKPQNSHQPSDERCTSCHRKSRCISTAEQLIPWPTTKRHDNLQQVSVLVISSKVASSSILTVVQFISIHCLFAMLQFTTL